MYSTTSLTSRTICSCTRNFLSVYCNTSAYSNQTDEHTKIENGLKLSLPSRVTFFTITRGVINGRHLEDLTDVPYCTFLTFFPSHSCQFFGSTNYFGSRHTPKAHPRSRQLNLVYRKGKLIVSLLQRFRKRLRNDKLE